MKVQMQEMLNKLKELLVSFSTYIEMENKNDEFGINKLAENIIGGLLGIIFGCEFKNMNVPSQNYPTIDLADEDKRIAVQITSENASRKILETVAGIKAALTIKIFFAKKPPIYTEICGNIIRSKVFLHTFIYKRRFYL